MVFFEKRHYILNQALIPLILLIKYKMAHSGWLLGVNNGGRSVGGGVVPIVGGFQGLGGVTLFGRVANLVNLHAALVDVGDEGGASNGVRPRTVDDVAGLHLVRARPTQENLASLLR